MSRPTFEGLNALRGIAAVAVVLFHAEDVLGLQLVPNGGLAVDFFFLLSGFIVAHAYDARLRAGLSLREFMTVRLARFYPMYLLATAIGVVIIAGLFLGGDVEFPVWQPFAALLLGALFLPMPPSAYSSQILYPLNGPAWSLAVELAINGLYAAFFRWMTTPLLFGIAAVGLVFLLGEAAIGNVPAEGASWPTLVLGYARALFSFPLGVAIYRLGPGATKSPRAFGLAAAVLIASLIVQPGTALFAMFQLAFITLISPLILLGGIGPVATGFSALGRYLGRTSYPIYALHVPALVLTSAVARRLGIDQQLTFAGLLVTLLATCWWLDRLDERWRRKWIRDRRQKASDLSPP